MNDPAFAETLPRANPRGARPPCRPANDRDPRDVNSVQVRRDLAVPLHAPALRIGLLGGSFNPPHEGHRLISLFAMKRLRLDRVWWLVSPGNPLKDICVLPPLTDRIAAARRLARHPRIDVTGLEAAINTRYTIDTLAWLRRRCSNVRFVWIMGADNLKDFHRWRKWRRIAALVPIAVVDRPGSLDATGGRAAHALAHARVAEANAAGLARQSPPAWVLLHGVKSPLSSTALRLAREERPRG